MRGGPYGSPRLVLMSLAVVVLAAGCGGKVASTTTSATTAKPPPVGLRVGVVGQLDVKASGAVISHLALRATADQSLVIVTAWSQPNDTATAAAAVANPSTHYALVGRSAAALRLPNLVGVVIRDDQAARLGGAVAGLAVRGEQNRRVAWVGPQNTALADAFVQGVHAVEPGTVVLRAWSVDLPASCKESALGAIARGATVVMAPHGLCAAAAIDGAHERNQPGLQLSDFELPGVAAVQIVRDAIHGRYHGREDILFGAASGAVGVRNLDPRFPAAVTSQARTLAEQLANGQPLSG